MWEKAVTQEELGGCYLLEPVHTTAELVRIQALFSEFHFLIQYS